ncbi:MAG: sugar ABC transporter permease [Anaerolineales bacterium]|nr:sugar ABC transporter permease [Anaerolineales bacterium]
MKKQRLSRYQGKVSDSRFRLTFTQKQNLWGFAFLVPGFVLLIVFKLYPMILAARLSFYEYNLISPEKFVGLKNYEYLLTDNLFHQSVMASVYYVVGSVVVIWVLSLLLALAFNRDLPYKNVLRSIYFMPVVMPSVIVAVLWKYLYHPYGVVNAILHAVGLPAIDWLSNSAYAMPALIAIGIWRGTPYFMVIFLAGLQAIPKAYYEAAEIDGATGWKAFIHITLPLLRPTTVLVMVMSVIIGIMVFINPIIVTNFGGPAGATRVLPLYIFQTGFEFFKMGLASAASIILFAIVMSFTLVRFQLFGEE